MYQIFVPSNKNGIIPFNLVLYLGIFLLQLVVEYIFDWKGMGVVIVDALDKYDFPVVMGSLLYVSVILVIINIIVDIIYGWLDPRVKTA